jgi:hypothetical protein
MVASLSTFNNKHEELFAQDRASLYRTYHIFKKTGGVRRIDAPTRELMTALRELKTLLEEELSALHHTSAFGYVRRRSTVDAIKLHQKNESRWFLKLDFSDFFGSTTIKFVMSMLALMSHSVRS